VQHGYASTTDFCTRERDHDGPHANAFTQVAWVERRIDLPVTYRWPYEDMTVDTTVEVKGLGHPMDRYNAARSSSSRPANERYS